jgi:transposase
MMGEQQRGGKGASWRALGAMIPADHMLHRIDGLIDLGELRDALAPHYSCRGRPSIAPELLVRMALIARLYGITSERRLCEEVRFNLAYRWFCRLPLNAPVPHHSTFSKNRHGRFRDASIFRILFEQTVRRCADAGLIAHKDAAIDASFVAADASWQRKMRDADMAAPRLPRPVCEWLADQANAPPQEHGVPRGKPAEVSRTDPASAWSARTARGRFGYAFNVLIDTPGGGDRRGGQSRPLRRGSRCGADHAGTGRQSVRLSAKACRGRHRLWQRCVPGVRHRSRHHPAYPGAGTIRTDQGQIPPRSLPL